MRLNLALKVGGAQCEVAIPTKMAGNCEACVLKALKSRTKKLSLDNNGLKTLSVSVGRLGFLETLSAKNNDLLFLPEEIANLRQV